MRKVMVLALLPLMAFGASNASSAGGRTVVEAKCTVGAMHTCHVLFDADEHYSDVFSPEACTDAAPPQAAQGSAVSAPTCVWRISGTSRASGVAGIEITPSFADMSTDAAIYTTKKRVYIIHLKSDNSSNSAVLDFSSSPQATAVAANMQVSAVPQVPAVQSGPRWSAWDLDYAICGSAGFRPLWVANDGLRTIVAMPGSPEPMQVVPSITIPVQGQQFAVTPAVNNRVWLFEGVPERFELRAGNEVVIVVRSRECPRR